jgi:hypothetical protein
MPISPYPLYSDNISTINATFTDLSNVSTLQVTPSSLRLSGPSKAMNLAISSINFSDSNGSSLLNTTTLDINTSAGKKLSLSGINSSFDITTSGSLNLNVSSLLLKGLPAPGGGANSLIGGGANGLQWFSISNLLSLEAGVYTNSSSNTSANIQFAADYASVPAVILTPDSDGSGNIIAVGLDNVSVGGFTAIFAQSNLKRFHFVVLPVNTAYTI